MNDLQIIIDDYEVDLSEDDQISFLFQINTLADLKGQNGNTSNQFKLPPTKRNQTILGFPDDLSFANIKPYRQYKAKVIVSGIEIIPEGVAELNSIENGAANIVILSGNVDFFDAIDGQLYDMGDSTTPYGENKPWSKYDFKWELKTVALSQKNTWNSGNNQFGGWIWPIVDYGKIPDDATNNEIVLDVRDMRPGFFLKTAIDLMVANVGYRARGALLDHPLYPLLIVQFANDSFTHGTDYQNQPDITGMSVVINQNFTVRHLSAANSDGHLTWSLVSDPDHRFLSGYVYNAPSQTSVDITVKIPKFYLYGRVTGNNPTNVEIEIILSTPGVGQSILTSHIFEWEQDFNRISGSGGNIIGDKTILNTTISASTVMGPGQQIAIGYKFHGDTPAVFSVYAGATWDVVTQNDEVVFGQTIQCERIFPDISQKDLLKDTLWRFGIICQTDIFNKTITFASFRDIVNNVPIAKDWTYKVVDMGKSVYFKLGNYSQVNNMKYTADDNVKPFADAVIKIDDKTLPAQGDLFTSPFAPTLNRPFLGGTIAKINKVDPTDEDQAYSIGTAPRILIDQKRSILGGKYTVRFTDGTNSIVVNDVISVPYFDKPDAPSLPAPFGKASLLFEELRKANYPEVEKVLKNTKRVIRFFMLDPRDIQELDLLIPVYLQQDGAYYYISKIEDWVRGQPTKVELVRL